MWEGSQAVREGLCARSAVPSPPPPLIRTRSLPRPRSLPPHHHTHHTRHHTTQTIGALDEKKREALEKTWRKVTTDFGAIFSTLLPGTTAKLEPQEGCSFMEGEWGQGVGRRAGEREGRCAHMHLARTTAAPHSPPRPLTPRPNPPAAGLEVRVAFGGVWKESLSELSGGQKSLLALSLILAMLLFKPAPIYILDEVDAALDLSHTQNIGRMIKQHFPQSQVRPARTHAPLPLHMRLLRCLARCPLSADSPARSPPA